MRNSLSEHGNECECSYTICVVLAVIALTVSIGIGAYFAYKYTNHWYLKRDVFVLSLVPVLKQQFNELINGEIQTNRDQKSNLLFLKQHNIKEFNSSLLKIDKKSYKDIDIYYIRYITMKKIGDCQNIYSVNPYPLYLIMGKVDGHTECSSSEEKNKE